MGSDTDPDGIDLHGVTPTLLVILDVYAIVLVLFTAHWIPSFGCAETISENPCPQDMRSMGDIHPDDTV